MDEAIELDSQRPYSIRTRIKTRYQRLINSHVFLVRDHIPLEQGLRRSCSQFTIYLFKSQRPYSIRTRIKTPSCRCRAWQSKVRDHIPLEQGLRRNVHYPVFVQLSQRPYSIRTRIKTLCRQVKSNCTTKSETIFH